MNKRNHTGRVASARGTNRLNRASEAHAPARKKRISPRHKAIPRAAASHHLDGKVRCGWAPADDAVYTAYHDKEWGVPVHDDRLLFEFLILEGAQAGLSWSTILHKRDSYRRAYGRFDPRKVARYTEKDVARLMKDPGIVRNRLKIQSSVSNAKAYLEVQKEFGSFDAYIWSFVGGRPLLNRWRTRGQVPARTEISDKMSQDLKKRGFRFVGSTICYAFMQATGMVNDHAVGCFRHRGRTRT